MRSALRLLRDRLLQPALVLAVLLPGCGGSGGGGKITIFSVDTVLAELIIAPADTVRTENGAVLTVTGDADIQGTLEAIDGPLHLRVGGALSGPGTIRSVHSSPGDPDPDVAFKDLGFGIYIVVGPGATSVGSDMTVRTNGPVVVTDDVTELDRTSRDAHDETDTASDTLPTLVPLPPEDMVFQPQLPAPPAAVQGGLPPVVITGRWDLSGLRGDRPVLLFRFNGSRDLDLTGWTVIPPAAPPGGNADESGDPGEDAMGQNGRPGLNLNIWNNGGPINVRGATVINLADGGDGGSATAVCATATGGDGGKPGNFRMTASGGINILGTLTINPGAAGNGGAATVTKGAAGAAGCPGQDGDDSTANGGNGGDNRKRIFVRGNVNGVGNITIGSILAGDGGNATATACDGGPGVTCCDGGTGGEATANGGKGGDASLHLGGFGVTHGGGVFGGDGGDATATGGNGGPGGACKFGDGGDGGMGGAADATSGAGGNAEALGGAGGALGGNSGDATATGGTGGPGGDTTFGMVGTGGGGGAGSATAGAVGAPSGIAGTENEANGMMGPDGMVQGAVFFCLPLGVLVSEGATLAPGVRMDFPVEDTNRQGIGSIDIELVPLSLQSQFVTSSTPVPHIGVSDGAVAARANTLMLNSGTPGPIAGFQIVPLFGQNIDMANPLLVEVRNALGEILAVYQISSIPNNQADPGNPMTIDIDFVGVDPADVAEVRVIVPPAAFVTFITLYLVDP